MRGTVDDLPTPYSFGAMLPAIYQEDDFAQRWMSAFDAVLSSIVSTIDNVNAYFDPEIAPQDFVTYLSSWVGVELDETWPDPARRKLVATAVELFKIRGTLAGLKRTVEIYTGVEPEIEENGGCAVSEHPNGELPGDPTPMLVVRVRVPEGAKVDATRLNRLVADAKPAHVPHRVEVVSA